MKSVTVDNMEKRVNHENLFENLQSEGLLVICAWCRKHRNRFNILNYHSQSLIKGMSHGLCNECSVEHFGFDSKGLCCKK
jgi:hypothetical protein